MTFGMPGWRGRLRNRRVLVAAVLVLTTIAACQPGAPPGFTATPPSSAGPGASGSEPQSSARIAGSPTVTVNGTTVQIVGFGRGVSPEFELPAGRAGMTVAVCESNQVIPFVTLYDADDNKLGIIVEPVYEIKNLAGGMYYVDVATNPDCVWTIEVTPA